MQTKRASQAIELMTRFAERTGLTSRRPRRRYLWTDAFAVCNFLGLTDATGDERFRDLAAQLVDQVHQELGHHRADDLDVHRAGRWLSGLSGSEGEAHPTRGGLRIGKRFPERARTEPFDADLEWERDGQYFHYLTKWMHALDQMARATANPTLHVWACDLAEVAHRAFTYGDLGGDGDSDQQRRRMWWKLSADLSRPLVRSMGQHDPLDGFVTCTELAATSTELRLRLAKTPNLTNLTTAAASDFATMIDREALATSDSLGLGGLLFDAFRLAQLNITVNGNVNEDANLGDDDDDHDSLIAALLAAAVTGLRQYLDLPDLRAPASVRLAFRELGLAIGLAAIPMLQSDLFATLLGTSARKSVAELMQYVPLASEIESFWLDPEHRRSSTWIDHADINDVMLATSLVPNSFLVLGPTGPTTALLSSSSAASAAAAAATSTATTTPLRARLET